MTHAQFSCIANVCPVIVLWCVACQVQGLLKVETDQSDYSKVMLSEYLICQFQLLWTCNQASGELNAATQLIISWQPHPLALSLIL